MDFSKVRVLWNHQSKSIPKFMSTPIDQERTIGKTFDQGLTHMKTFTPPGQTFF